MAAGGHRGHFLPGRASRHRRGDADAILRAAQSADADGNGAARWSRFPLHEATVSARGTLLRVEAVAMLGDVPAPVDPVVMSVHVLVRGPAATAARTVTIPGSDHRAVVARLDVWDPDVREDGPAQPT